MRCNQPTPLSEHSPVGKNKTISVVPLFIRTTISVQLSHAVEEASLAQLGLSVAHAGQGLCTEVTIHRFKVLLSVGKSLVQVFFGHVNEISGRLKHLATSAAIQLRVNAFLMSL